MQKKLITYYEQLQDLATLNGINLREAFRKAGIQDSTYHRIKTAEFSVREATAQQVWDYIHHEKLKEISKRT